MDRGELTARLLRFLDGDLTADEERQLAAEIRGNPSAQSLLAEMMRLHGQIPTVLQEAQGERAVRSGRRWVLPAAAAAVLAIAAGWLFLRAPAPAAGPAAGRVLSARGTVAARGAESRVLQGGMPLFAGDLMETRGPAAFELAIGGRFELEGASRLRLCRPEERARLELLAGGMEADVAPQPPDRPFIVKTPQGETEVVGTRFSLAVTAGATRLDVHEGRVLLRKASGEAGVLVEAGFTASAGEGLDPAPRPQARPAVRSTLKLTSPAANSVVQGETTFAVDPSTVPAGAAVLFLLNGKPLYDGGDPARPLTAPPYSVKWPSATVWDGFMTAQAVARDARGRILATSPAVPFQVANGSVKLTLVSPAHLQVVSGKVSWKLSTDMGPSVGKPVYIPFIDGKQMDLRWGGASHEMILDTTKMANGLHELFCALYAESKAGVLPHAMSHVLVDVQNGRAVRELRANFREVFLVPQESVVLRARTVYTNGDEEPAGASFKSSDPSVARVDPDGRVTGVAPGVAAITVTSGPASARVLATVDKAKACPHFSTEGKVLTAYTPGKSMFLRSMFWMDGEQFRERPQLGAAARKANVNALTTGFYHNPGGNPNVEFAAWKRGMQEKLDFQLRIAAENDLSLFLTGDDIARTTRELHDSATNPQSRAKIQYVIEWAKKTRRVVGIDMVDEVDFCWGDTPTPSDGRWMKRQPQVPDDAFVRLMEILDSVPDRPPLSWPVSGAAGVKAAANWAGNPKFSDFNTVFWHYAANFRRQYPTHNSCYQPVVDIERTMNERLAVLRRDQPLFLLTSAMGPNYWKEAAGDNFAPGRDRMSNAGNSPEAVSVQIMFAAARGMAGVRVYAYDANHCREQRSKTAPGDRRVEPQTGCDPFFAGTARWEAMAQAFTLIRQLEPFVLQPRTHALDLGDKVITGAREGKAGKLFLAVNAAEVPAPVRIDLAPYKLSPSSRGTRHRLTTTSLQSEPFSGDRDALVLESGETVAYAFPRP